MSECVVRMEIPQNCINCDLRYECNAFYTPGKPKPFMRGCMIVCQLPEGHGRLGDLDCLQEKVDAGRIRVMQSGGDTNPYWECGDFILQTPTIIPATKGEK